MTRLLMTALAVLCAGTAAASSIEIVKTNTGASSSVETRECPNCPALVVKKKSTYEVPVVAPGTEQVEIRSINGEMKVVRTESWSGGSPVVFISKASEQDIKAAMGDKLLPDTTASATAALPVVGEAKAIVTPNIIDSASTTASLAATGPTPVAEVPVAESQEFDPGKFELRLQ